MFTLFFAKLFKKFFAVKASRQVKELYISDMIINLATAMVALFEPIYLWTLGFSLEKILFFYLGVYALYFLLMPLGAKFARRFGYERAILVSTPFLVAFYLFLYLIHRDFQFAYLAVGALALQKTFYWPAYHADFARFSRNDERGREIGNSLVINSFVYIIGPFLGGLIISLWGFNVLFAVISVLILASNIPLATTAEKFKPVPFSYWHAYRRLVYAENRRNFLGFLGFGEELIVLAVWPVFIYAVLGNFFSVGSLVALATMATTLVLLYVGRLTDGEAQERRSILKVGSIFYSAAWWLRLLAGGSLGVFLVDTLSRISKSVIVVPMMAMTYQRANETSIMKTVVFFEMSLVVGKILAIVLGILALRYIDNSYSALFALAALMALLYSLIKYEPIKIK